MRLASILTVLVLTIWPFVADAQGSANPPIQFPLVFTSTDDTSSFGLSVTSAKQKPLLHRCYYYGDGGDLITVSHERLVRYRSMGFTLNSLCLGLMSSTLFDPETGRRLPSYIVIDAAAAAKGKVDTIDSTYEHPLELPKCFSRALPYYDCAFNFDRLTGKSLSEEQKNKFRELGKELNRVFQRAVAEKLVCAWPFCTERSSMCCVIGALAAGAMGPQICSNDGYLPYFIESKLAPHGISVSKDLMEGAHLSCFDVSVNLPMGFGYTTDADGTASPDISPELLKLALDPKHRASQIDPAAIAQLTVGPVVKKPGAPGSR